MNYLVSKDGATYSEVEGNLCPLLFHIGKEAGLLIGYKLISQSRGRGVREDASQKPRQYKARPHPA